MPRTFARWLILLLGACFRAAAADPFYQPAELCAALESFGFKTSEWAPVGPASGSVYVCQYPPVPPDSNAEPFDPSVLGVTPRADRFVYRVWTRRSRPADTISLAVVLSGGEGREDSKRTFADAIQKLYRALGASAPAGLSRAIQREVNYRAPAETRPGAVFSVHWREGSKVLWLRVSRPAPRPARR